ncbi:NlpC/P60 family protein [Citricoccus sp. NR2]|nr:C40 family peptidase [Citricoccus sp. NR2]WBL20734.1 NlpC/P60 family protein [Citricoccus sp. NR2]
MVSKRASVARHRATPASNFTLDAMSKAVTINAGNFGRQTAVVAAASTMVLTLGAPAVNASPVPTARDTSVLPAANVDLERASKATTLTVAEADAEVTIERASVSSTPAPEPEPEEDLTPVTNANVGQQSTTSTDSSASSTQQSQESVQTSTHEAEETVEQEAPASSASGSMGAVVSAAYSGIGQPYVFGGKGPGGWDCSGFTAWAYAQAGITIPSQTSAIRNSGQFVRTSTPKPGDLVYQNGGSHVGIYVGNGQMIGAQNPSVGTFLHSVSRNPLMGYYTYVG